MPNPQEKAKLMDLDIDEVSLVDKAANKRRFFFIKNNEGEEVVSVVPLEKANTSIELKSDGSYEGTSITVNGKEVDPLDFSLSLYKFSQDDGQVACRYTTASKGKSGGFKSIKTYVLAKAKESNVDTELIKSYLKEVDIDSLKEDTVETLAKNLDTLADYKDILPSEVWNSISELINLASIDDEISKTQEGEEMSNLNKQEKETPEEKEEVETNQNETEQPQQNLNVTVDIDYDKLADTLAAKLKEINQEKVEEPEDDESDDDETVEVTEEMLDEIVTEAVTEKD